MRPDIDTCRDPDLLAAEVRRLRDVIAASQPTLTDEERRAIEWAVEHQANSCWRPPTIAAACWSGWEVSDE